MPTIYKIKYKTYIADLYIPHNYNNKIVILAPGLPKSANIDKLLHVFLKSGTIVIYPNFSGRYDSAGEFDGWQSIHDIEQFINLAKQHEVKELYFGKKISLRPLKEIILVGMSFSTLACLLAEKKHVDKLLLLSPVFVLNQTDINKIENFDFKPQMNALMHLLKKAFPYTYRINFFRLKKFLSGKSQDLSIENIKQALERLNIPTCIVHGKFDHSVPYKITEFIQKDISNKHIEWLYPNVGHSNSSYDVHTLENIALFLK